MRQSLASQRRQRHSSGRWRSSATWQVHYTCLPGPDGNELIPLRNDDYPFAEHIEDVIRRQSRRSGMLLNSDELIGFVHLPSSAVRSQVLQRQSGKEAPAIVRQQKGLLLGNNVHLGESIPVRLTPEQRVYHTHIIGATGTGKSTLLFNLIRQDIENNQGVAVLDPHGDLVERILGIIPPERIKDVILVDPADEEFSIGFNILFAQNDHEKTLLASDLVSVFQRLSTSWGDQMQSVLQNAILAFLNSSKGGTLADLRRFLVEPPFRNEFLKTISDPNVLYYWHKGFSHLSGNKSIGPVLTRLEMFLAQRPIAHMVSQTENRLDFANIMDSGKIFLAKLPEGTFWAKKIHTSWARSWFPNSNSSSWRGRPRKSPPGATFGFTLMSSPTSSLPRWRKSYLARGNIASA